MRFAFIGICRLVTKVIFGARDATLNELRKRIAEVEEQRDCSLARERILTEEIKLLAQVHVSDVERWKNLNSAIGLGPQRRENAL